MSMCQLQESCGERTPCNRPFCMLPRCVACVAELAHIASAMAAGDNHALMKKAEAQARAVLDDGRKRAQIAPVLANKVLRAIKEATGVTDPFAEYKIQEMKQSREAFQRIADCLDGSLYACLKTAAIGNSLDFFKPPEEAFREVTTLLAQEDFFHHLDMALLENELSKGLELVLYMTDNSGEVFFDVPLYDYLRKRVRRLVLVVKGEAPALNDLTRADLEREGLLERFEEVADTGTDGAGVDWDSVSPAFVSLLETADLVLCKGGANFETVYPRPFTAPAFFLFKVKCRPDQMDFFESPPQVFWGLWRERQGGKSTLSDRDV